MSRPGSYFHQIADQWRRRALDQVGASERGDTLVEVLLAIVIVSVAALALLTGFATAINASARTATSLRSILRPKLAAQRGHCRRSTGGPGTSGTDRRPLRLPLHSLQSKFQ